MYFSSPILCLSSHYVLHSEFQPLEYQVHSTTNRRAAESSISFICRHGAPWLNKGATMTLKTSSQAIPLNGATKAGIPPTLETEASKYTVLIQIPSPWHWVLNISRAPDARPGPRTRGWGPPCRKPFRVPIRLTSKYCPWHFHSHLRMFC